MNENIIKLYNFYRENALLITKMHSVESLYRRQFNGSAGNQITEISKELARLEAYPEYINVNSFQEVLSGIVRSLQSEDYVLCADMLNVFTYNVMFPLQQAVFNDLHEYISELYESLTQNADGLFTLEETSCGYATILYHSDRDIYLCSTEDPLMEAFILANEIFAPSADSYHIWGIGLGYHVYALYQITHGATDIYVYDNDPILFNLAHSEKLGTWQTIFNESRIHLVDDKDATKFAASLKNEKVKPIIHTPSLYKLSETDILQCKLKTVLKKLQISLNSFEEQKNGIYLNFYKNIDNADGYAEDLFPEYNDQNVVIVAAGPSLDKNIQILKEAKDNNAPIKIICVGTVLKKLINIGIVPDAFCVMDANEVMLLQIKGVETNDIPVIYGSGTYFGIAQNYLGKKYLACQKGFEPAEKTGHHLFNNGNSVTTLAIDFAIQAKAKRIILVGCDMAYTGNASHASATVQKHNTDNENVIGVKGYYGETVNSSIQLSIFREWIERRILSSDAKNIEFINSTEGGAYIDGMKHFSLNEVIKHSV